MFVLMDLEWNDETVPPEPTQIAAMRIGPDGTVLDMFFERVRPEKPEEVRWNHIAYSGGSADLFRKSKNGYLVIKKLGYWLKKDDILLWWHEEAATFFSKLINGFGFPKVRSGVICHILRDLLTDGISTRGNPYELAKKRGIAVPLPEHLSLNDVTVLYMLLLRFCPSLDTLIEKGCLEWESAEHNCKNEKEKTGNKKEAKCSNSSFMYAYVPSSGFFHVRGCACYNQKWKNLQYYETMRECLFRKQHPCECCRAEAERMLQTDPVFMNRCIPLLSELYKKEQSELIQLCQPNNLTLILKEEMLYIQSRYGFWRILMDAYTGKPALYHRSNINRKAEPQDRTIPMYHRQNLVCDTLEGCIRNIIRHDDYCDHAETEVRTRVYKVTPENTPLINSNKGRKLARMWKQKQYKKQMSRVLSMIEEMENLEK